MQRPLRFTSWTARPTASNGSKETAGDESILAWIRQGTADSPPVLIVSNFTPVERRARRIGVPEAGRWIERLNTDSEHYGGQGRGNLGGATSQQVAASGRAHSIDDHLAAAFDAIL